MGFLYSIKRKKLLKIRLARTGRKNYPSYRIVVAEHSSAVQGKFIDIVGHYIPVRDPKVFEYDAEKIKEWINKGAKPSDTVATLLKNAGMPGMEKYIKPRNKNRKKKKEDEEVAEETAGVEESKTAEEGGKAPVEKSEEQAPAEETAPTENEEKPKEETATKEAAPDENQAKAKEETPEEAPKQDDKEVKA